MIIQKIIKNSLNEKLNALKPIAKSTKPKVAVVFDFNAAPSQGLALNSFFSESGLASFLVVGPDCKHVAEENLVLTNVTLDAIEHMLDSIAGATYDIDLVVMLSQDTEPTSFLDVNVEAFQNKWEQQSLSYFYVAQLAIKRMLKYKAGTIIFSGTEHSLEGQSGFSVDGSIQVGVRMLAQSLAREFWPKGIHIAHLVTHRKAFNPQLYWDVYKQHKTTWSQEIIS